VLHLTLSRGQLVKVLHKATAALAGAYEQLRALLPKEDYLNVDETGHKEKGQRWWTWCFRAQWYTLFKIDQSRGSQVLIDLLGREFQGVLGCDYFSAYHKYMGDFGVTVQFCLAHLIRDVKFLTELPDPVTAAYGQRVLERLRHMFHVIHRRATMDPVRFQRALAKARDELRAVGKRAPQRSEAQNMAKRFREHGEAYFRFITTPGVEPTNNLAEQAMRFVVIDRLVTQGTRSEKGRRWDECIWTAIASVGTAIGPTLGGFLVEQLGWRSIFLVNVPVGIVVVWLTLRFVAESRDERPRTFDVGTAIVRVAENPPDMLTRLAAILARHTVEIVPLDSTWVDDGMSLGSMFVARRRFSNRSA